MKRGAVKLSLEELSILKKLTVKQLQYFAKITDDPDFNTMVDTVNLLIDLEKNLVMQQRYDKPDKLFYDHAYSKGSMASITKFLRIIVGSRHELALRDNERKEKS